MAALNLVIPISTPETDAALAAILTKLESIVKSLEDLKADVAAQKTVIDSAVELLTGLHAEVVALKPNQEDIDALAAKIESQTADLKSAVAANTES